MDAIISDIEGNLEALEAVLDSAQQFKVDRIICLGDIVGYGPNPVECAGLLRSCDLYINPEWPTSMLRKLAWVRKQFAPHPEPLNFLRSGKTIYKNGNKTYFHGTPQRISEYIFPEDIYIHGKLDRIIETSTAVSFCGHSHWPGMFNKNQNWKFIAPTEFSEPWNHIDKQFHPIICCVGSVRQPRDGDSRASYVLSDRAQVRFIRVDYDREKTKRKILDNPDQDDNDGRRLDFGR